MKANKTQAALAAAVAGLALAACGNLFSSDSDGTDTRVAISSDVTALLDETGIQVESWTLMCYFASGNYMEETSASGAFSVQFPDDDIAAVFAKPAFASDAGLGESAVPGIGALYPYYGELGGGGVKQGARLELGFCGGVAAEAALYWNAAEMCGRDFAVKDRVDAVFRVSKNFFNGAATPQMIVTDLKRSAEGPSGTKKAVEGAIQSLEA